jgi:hypothetical protein
MSGAITYPGNKRFAFTIVDDTDDSRVENIKAIYDLLADLSFFTTKTVWPEACPEGSSLFFAGDTLARSEYREFCVNLQQSGFEITWHGATMESSIRERTLRGLETFRQAFGHYPTVHVNHGHNLENIYWGASRYRTPLRLLASLRRGDVSHFEGERELSPHFWGDLCQKHMRFVRNFAFREINTLKCDPHTPYRLRSTPYVNWWFSASDAADVTAFNALVTPSALERLCREGGVCILATHLGKGFVSDGVVNPRVEGTLRYLARLPVWVAPVSQLLNYLLESGHGQFLTGAQLLTLELRHARDRISSHR